MHRALDLAAGATAALRRADGAGLGQKRPDLTRATSTIRAAAQAIVDLAGCPGAAAVSSDSPLDLAAGQNVAGADDHAWWPTTRLVSISSPSALRRRTMTSTEEIIMPSGASGSPATWIIEPGMSVTVSSSSL